MPYPAIAARRMPYDIDGTEVGYRTTSWMSMPDTFAQGIANWLDETSKSNLNKEDRQQTWTSTTGSPTQAFWFFLPEIREITHLAFLFPIDNTLPLSFLIQGSSDTTNGMDGTWETGVYTVPESARDADFWRNKIFAVSFSGPVKVLRVAFNYSTGGTTVISVCAIHVYGHKAAGQTPDDVIFCDSAGIEKTALMDWSDVPEGTTDTDTFYVKNVSTKQANGINIQLNHADYLISTDQVNWGAVIDITSLTAGQISAPIYVKLALNPPLLTLGPKSARAIATITSWT